MITWDDPNERYFEHGVDHGVLYPAGGTPVPWNGITGVDESGTGSKSILYRDGRIYYSDVDPGDFEGKLTAFFFPEEFAVCAGIPEIANGLYVDNQRPKSFSLSYRSLIGSGNTGDIFGYQIHLLYNAVAQIGTRSRRTMTNSPDLMQFNFDLCATPVQMPGMRPSAHYIIDTRHLTPEMITQLEAMLYDEAATGLPDPVELYDLLKFGSSITFVDHGDGTWTGSGSSANLQWTSDTTWVINNVNGTDNGDGTYELVDTP